MDTEFKDRLVKACNEHPDIPPFGSGRQTVIAKKIGVSQEAVRKWFVGEAKPRPRAMSALAKFLKVDNLWLSMGADFREKDALKDVARQKDTGLYAFCGYATDNGYTVGINDDNETTADLMLIRDAHVVFVKVINVKAGAVQMKQQTQNVITVLAYRNADAGFSFDFYVLPEPFNQTKKFSVLKKDGACYINKVKLNLFT